MTKRTRWAGAGVLALLSAAAATGCGVSGQAEDGADESRVLGDVSLGLILPDGTSVSTVDFVLTRNGVEVRTGSMPVGADGRASALIANLEAGPGYHVVLSASRDGGSSCEGEADFEVFVGQTRNVNVVLQCSELTVDGNIAINGSFNVCPKVGYTTASPVTVAIGSSTDLVATARDRDGDPLSYAWTASDGTFSAPTALNTLYTCASAGAKTLTFSASDGPSRGCTRSSTVSITCVGGGDAGTDGGVDSGTDGGTDGGVPATTLSASSLAVGGNGVCGIQSADGRLACWGTPAVLGDGALGLNRPAAQVINSKTTPQGLNTSWKFVDSSTGNGVCAITTAGAGYCWGNGALGNGSDSGTGESPTSIDMRLLPAGATWSSVSVGGNFACGITSDGTGYCWGGGANGQRGDGSLALTYSPVPLSLTGLPAGTKWSSLSAGTTHACGITTDGVAYCWGSDSAGQLGNGAATGDQSRPRPVNLVGLPADIRWASLGGGGTHTCGLTTAGKLYCWGSDTRGELGNGSLPAAVSPSPVEIAALPAGIVFTSLTVGDSTACAVSSEGAAYCWGRNNDGRLGNGATANALSPVAVDLSAMPAGTKWAVFSAGGPTCGLTTEAKVYCFGSNSFGQIGKGTATPTNQLRPEFPVLLGSSILFDAATVIHVVGDSRNAPLSMSLVPPAGVSADGFRISAVSSNEAVVTSAGITVSGNGVERTVSFQPIARGNANITFTVTNPTGTPTVFSVLYAVSAAMPDASGRYHAQISDASTAIDVGDGYMLLANDETNLIFLFKQNESAPPVKTWSFTTVDQLGTRELDFEGAARVGNQILWTSGQANGRDGESKPHRRVLFATNVTGTGANIELAFAGRYGGHENEAAASTLGLRTDLINWDVGNGHGLGANYLRFLQVAQPGVFPNAPNGFNVEGFEFAANGTTAYLGFRAPTIDRNGVQSALIVPVTNVLSLVNGVQQPQSGRAQFGAPIFLNLAGRSIRELRRNDSGEYLISAGPPDNPTLGVNDKWALYSWDGIAGHEAVFNRELPNADVFTGGTWESIVSVPHPLVPGAAVRLVTDSGDSDFYGMGQTKDLASSDLKKSYSQSFTLN
jgi:alpha-tubulin suppressor-like RCC1 family protein